MTIRTLLLPVLAVVALLAAPVWAHTPTQQVDQSWGTSVRLTWAPLLEQAENRVVHLGLSGGFRDYSSGSTVRCTRQKP